MQVARAVEQMLGDEEGQAEQMVAVLDARQATTLQVTRKVNLIKQLALDLNQVSTLQARLARLLCSATSTSYISCPHFQALQTTCWAQQAPALHVFAALLNCVHEW